MGPQTVFIQYRPEVWVDQGGPCGHSNPFTGADDCLCRDGYLIPAGFDTGYSLGYCDRDHRWDNAPF